MQKKKPALFAVILSFLIICLVMNSSLVFASSGILKEGMSGSQVTELQKDLNTLGYLDASPTGYYGSLTTAAVKKLQGSYGLKQDGIAGTDTFSLIKRLISERTATRSSSSMALKEGMSGSSVTALQRDLKALGYLNVDPTGYFGSLTKEAVVKIQAKHGLEQDGIAGRSTLALIDKLMGRSGSSASQLTTTATRGGIEKTNYIYSWFGNAENIFKIGDTAQVYDIKTGRTFDIKRTYGYNHADCETLTAKDTEIMLDIYGGSWSWERRPIIIIVNGRKMAASMAGMPHAGVDSAPANTYVSSRSGGYGGGDNLDAVKNNKMNGVFDVHFLNSKTHGTSKVDKNHQNALKEAAEWAEKNSF
ncbi:MAG TPA: peptidoglycan-binding protein [Clostridium sp.]|nr:peptidoglycan-binding protein [Clostridium sp.]